MEFIGRRQTWTRNHHGAFWKIAKDPCGTSLWLTNMKNHEMSPFCALLRKRIPVQMCYTLQIPLPIFPPVTSCDVTQCAAVITWRSVTVTPVHPESSLTAVEKGNFCEAISFGMWKRLLNCDRSLLYLQGLRAPEEVSHIGGISDVLW